MKDREFEKYLYEELRKCNAPKKLEETIILCTSIMNEQRTMLKEKRTGFFKYLSDIFRFEGLSIFGLQALSLFIAFMGIVSVAGAFQSISMFIPLFVLAVMPSIFRGQYYAMSEIEAATRASGAQIVLAKLVLSGAANLVAMTLLWTVEIYLGNRDNSLGQIILYSLVPYLVCMTGMLKTLRLRNKTGIYIQAVILICSVGGWGMTAKEMPWLYRTSAMGIWIIAFILFTVFFAKEIIYIIQMRKEGKMYGIIA